MNPAKDIELQEAVADGDGEQVSMLLDIHFSEDESGYSLKPTMRQWWDASKELRRLFSLMFCGGENEVEEGSPYDGILEGAVNVGRSQVIQDVAEILGVDIAAVWSALYDHEELPKNLGANEFMELIKERTL